LSVRGESDEKIESMIVASEGNGVLETLVHVSRATGVRGWEDNAVTDVMEINVSFSVSHGVFKAAVQSGAQLRLVGFDPSETVLIT
jgi:hypothetical protein